MPTGRGHGKTNETGRSCGKLLPARGSTFRDRNLSGNKVDLASFTSSEAVRKGRFEFFEITLGMNVLVTLPYLLEEVSVLCRVLERIRVLKVRLLQYKSGFERVRLGCHISGLLTRFSDDNLPLPVDGELDDPTY